MEATEHLRVLQIIHKRVVNRLVVFIGCFVTCVGSCELQKQVPVQWDHMNSEGELSPDFGYKSVHTQH